MIEDACFGCLYVIFLVYILFRSILSLIIARKLHFDLWVLGLGVCLSMNVLVFSIATVRDECLVVIVGNPNPAPSCEVDSEKQFRLLLVELPPKKAAAMIAELTGENKK
ncbi:MAG: hypothetical protein EOM68_07695 [Spirochaetia bacterium]|nr:hypothetical protein [Spirochaetia bacterium]